MVTQENIDAIFKALSDPTRRSILASLRDKALAVATISRSFPEMSRPAISKHLRILRQAGLVAEEQQGRQRFHRFVERSLDQVGAWVESFGGARTGGGGAEREVWRGRQGRRPRSDGWRVW